MKKVIVVLIGTVLAVSALTGCTDSDEPNHQQKYETQVMEENIRLGKMCADAGGAWEKNGWTGYQCEFPAK